jgi:hypothetical protein
MSLEQRAKEDDGSCATLSSLHRFSWVATSAPPLAKTAVQPSEARSGDTATKSPSVESKGIGRVTVASRRLSWYPIKLTR